MKRWEELTPHAKNQSCLIKFNLRLLGQSGHPAPPSQPPSRAPIASGAKLFRRRRGSHVDIRRTIHKDGLSLTAFFFSNFAHKQTLEVAQSSAVASFGVNVALSFLRLRLEGRRYHSF